MEDNMHEVVRLLIARMDSHPEEFRDDAGNSAINTDPKSDRWWRARTLVNEYGSEEEKAAFNAAIRKIQLKVAYDWMMDELLNGQERRRKMKEDADEYRMRNQQALAAQQIYNTQYSSGQALTSTDIAASVPLGVINNSGISESLIERLRKKGWV